MAKKADLLEKAAELKLAVTDKNTIAEIEAAIAGAEKHEVREAHVAKAGKRSEKALKEAEEKAEKEARKEAGDTTPQSDETEAHVKKALSLSRVLASNVAARTTKQPPNTLKPAKYTHLLKLWNLPPRQAL